MFETVLFNIIKVLTSSLEMVFAFVLLSRFFERKYESPWLTRIAYVAGTGLIVVLQETGYLGGLKTFTEIAIIIVVALALFSGKLRDKAIFIVIFSLMLSIAQILSVFALSWLSNKLTFVPENSFFIRVLNLEMPYMIMLAVVLLLSIFMKNKSGERIHFRYWLMLLTVPATVLVTLTVYQFYIEQLPPDETISSYIYISTAGLLFITILTFTLFARLQKQLSIAESNRDLRLQMSLQEQSIKKLEVSYNRTRELRHDLKNHLACMYRLINQEDYDGLRQYLNTMTDAVEDSTYIAISENPAVDAMLNEKLYLAQRRDTNLQFEIGSLHDTKAQPMDLCIILSNALDNAIEACEKIEDVQERYVHVKINESDDFTVISVVNPTAVKPIKSHSGQFLSDKGDKQSHGIGLKSIKHTAEKYKGEMLTKYDDGLFTLIVKLNYDKNKAQTT